MRPTENGEWGAKQKKIYDLDENGEKIPVIDKKTGQQKVDKRNRKQRKCYTADSTDWNSKENAKIWRKNLADTINAINEQLGIALHWEHRSFKAQGSYYGKWGLKQYVLMYLAIIHLLYPYIKITDIEKQAMPIGEMEDFI